MKSTALFAFLLLVIPAAGGLVIAQTAGSPAKSVATTPAPAQQHEHEHGLSAGAAPGQHEEMMCGKMMGGGGMGAMMGGGMNPMMGADTKIAVKNVDKGVTMTFTSEDAGAVARLRKMAEGMRLMHEAMSSEH